MINLNNLLTEKRNPYTLNIDNVSTLEMCMLLNEEDKRVAIAIRNVLPQIAIAYFISVLAHQADLAS